MHTRFLFLSCIFVHFLVACAFSLNEATREPKHVLLHSIIASESHVRPLVDLARILYQRGHTVTVASFDNVLDKFNVAYEGFSIISFGPYQPILSDPNFHPANLVAGESVDLNALAKARSELMEYEYGIVHESLKLVIGNIKPDIIVSDWGSEPCIDAAFVTKLPLVLVSSSFLYEMTPYQTSFTAALFDSDLPPTTETLSLWRRLDLSVIGPLQSALDIMSFTREVEALRRNHGVPNDLPSLDESPDVLQLINTFFGFEPAVPLPPNVHVVGPILSDTYPDLSEPLASFLATKNSVVYVAFGGNAVLSPAIVHMLFNALLNLIDNNVIDGVVWGYGMTNIRDFPDFAILKGQRVSREDMTQGTQEHVWLVEWAPQFAVLASESVKIFVSHGGAQSSLEALYNGKRILVMPVVTDQPRNAHNLVSAGVALRIDHKNLSSWEIQEKITTLLRDSSGGFAENLLRMRDLAQLGSRRKQHAVDLIEEVMYASRVDPATGAMRPTYLETADKRMSWIKANNIDLWTVVGGVAMVGLWVVIKVVIKLGRYMVWAFGLIYREAKVKQD